MPIQVMKRMSNNCRFWGYTNNVDTTDDHVVLVEKRMRTRTSSTFRKTIYSKICIQINVVPYDMWGLAPGSQSQTQGTQSGVSRHLVKLLNSRCCFNPQIYGAKSAKLCFLVICSVFFAGCPKHVLKVAVETVTLVFLLDCGQFVLPCAAG